MSIGSKIAGFGKTIADGTKKMGREMTLFRRSAAPAAFSV